MVLIGSERIRIGSERILIGSEVVVIRSERGLDRFRRKISMPHKTLSTTGKTERAEKQRTEKKSRQTLSTFCLDFGWIRGDGIEGLQRAGWIEASQRAKNARKGA